MKLRGMTLVMTRPTLSTNRVWRVYRAATSKGFFSPLGRVFFPRWAGFFFPTSFFFARNSGITLASFIRPLRRPLAGPASVSFSSKASVTIASKESRQRQEDR